MVLNDGDIRYLIENHLLVLEKVEEWQIQPASLDVRYGSGPLTLFPGDFALASTLETVEIPAWLSCRISDKSSWLRKGLTIGSGFADPGFTGQLTLELKNHHPNNRIDLRPGEPIAQLIFFELTALAERPYGSSGLGSKYKGQVGPTSSWEDHLDLCIRFECKRAGSHKEHDELP